uniref:Uncharacterized protein n=1 Tax=Oryza sativa subsp. japonica TaxID=39947 RepID=Q7F1U4_ORYSJ|nr:hypothetical protein [Oryza sativa Japonica Group]
MAKTISSLASIRCDQTRGSSDSGEGPVASRFCHSGCERLLVIVELVEDVDDDKWRRMYSSSRSCISAGSKIIITSPSDKIAKLGTNSISSCEVSVTRGLLVLLQAIDAVRHEAELGRRWQVAAIALAGSGDVGNNGGAGRRCHSSVLLV